MITIGITADADAEALSRTSSATGAGSYVADRPSDIVAVVAQAIATRLR